jgi:hypothetical protein
LYHFTFTIAKAKSSCIVLIGYGRTEQCHNAVTGELVDGTFMAVNILHQDFETAIHHLVDFFGIKLFRD